MALGVALRYVLEALKKTQGTKMYMFGLTALDRFKTRWAVYSDAVWSGVYLKMLYTEVDLLVQKYKCYVLLCVYFAYFIGEQQRSTSFCIVISVAC